MKAVRLDCLLAAILVTTFSAGALHAQTRLADAVLIASERDPGITAMRQQVARRGVDIEAARDERYPQFSLSADTSSVDANGAGITLTVSQVLYDWGRVEGMIASASQQRVKAVSDLKMAIEELTLDVSNYYIDVEVLDLKIARTQDYLDFAQRISANASERAEAGLGDRGEVARAGLEVGRTQDRLQQLRSDRGLALAQLQFLMGRAPGGVSAPPDLGFTSLYGSGNAISSAVRMSPDFVGARAEAVAAEAGIGVAKAKRLPTIRLQAEARGGLNGGRSRTAVGLSAGVDLNSGAFQGRQIQAARLDAAAARSNMDAIGRNLANAARTAMERIRVLRASETSQRNQLVQADAVLATYEEQFTAGQRELIDLLTTARDLYDAQMDAIDTYDDRRRAEYQAARDLGVLGTLILSRSRSG